MNHIQPVYSAVPKPNFLKVEEVICEGTVCYAHTGLQRLCWGAQRLLCTPTNEMFATVAIKSTLFHFIYLFLAWWLLIIFLHWYFFIKWKTPKCSTLYSLQVGDNVLTFLLNCVLLIWLTQERNLNSCLITNIYNQCTSHKTFDFFHCATVENQKQNGTKYYYLFLSYYNHNN